MHDHTGYPHCHWEMTVADKPPTGGVYGRTKLALIYNKRGFCHRNNIGFMPLQRPSGSTWSTLLFPGEILVSSIQERLT